MDTHDVKQAAAKASDHPALETAARVGYATSGLLHLLIGWIALQVAVSATPVDRRRVSNRARRPPSSHLSVLPTHFRVPRSPRGSMAGKWSCRTAPPPVLGPSSEHAAVLSAAVDRSKSRRYGPRAMVATSRLLGRSQVVRQRILIPPFPGSSPGAPAIGLARLSPISDVQISEQSGV